MVVIFIFAGKLSLLRRIAISLLIPYIFLVLASTVLDRPTESEMKYILKPFWSYKEIAKGGEYGDYIKDEVFLNVLMLVPVGILVPLIAKRKRLLKTLIVALSTTAVIETLQLVLKRGYFEFDDIFHNTAGALGAAILTIIVYSILTIFSDDR